MTQTEKMKNFLTKNGLGASCNEMLKKYIADTGIKVAYAAFRRVYIMFTPEGENIKQTERLVAPGFETEKKESKNGIAYLIWKNIPDTERVGHDCIGSRVFVANWSEDRSEYEVLRFHKKGEAQWPDSDGVTLLEVGTEIKRYISTDAVRLKNARPTKKVS